MRILYIDIDSMNPRHMGCYGYHRNTTPTIDAIAKQGVRLDNCYTSDAPCLPSRTAFYSGRFGIHTGVVGHGRTAADPKPQGPSRDFRDWFVEQGLAGQLAQAGFHTAMISPFGERHGAHHFYAGFREIHNTGKNGMESAEEVRPVVDKWMNDHAAEDNWYMHINYWDPHSPFRVPMEEGNAFENEPLPPWFNEDVLERHMKLTGPHGAIDKGMYVDGPSKRFPRVPSRIDSMENLKRWIDGYDCGVKYVDDQIAAIVKQLKDAGVYDDTAIIISADHGENQGDLGIYSEHGTADNGTCKIPMIVKWPGGNSGTADDGLHYNVDWAPTIMDLLGRDVKCPIWDGQSYAGLIKPDAGPTDGRDDLIVSQCCHVCQRSVRFDKYLYMRTYHDGFRLYPQEMLFDLDADVLESNNIAAENPELCREGAWRLARWHDAQMQKMAKIGSDVVDPLWTVIREGGPMHAQHLPPNRGEVSPLVKYIPRLEATGRADGAAALREKYGEYLPKDLLAPAEDARVVD